ncbi:hypothetical protein [Glaciimonas sp. PCH181]|uniref:hypothetical protein n=1 Tax=Glaciimonas sp. PCH181 TaxID=2133943 RepID=UPI000D33A1FA|nr:hypothetical protein [Glaciimonas sp. PCH181]PUA19351.1 hypothetical protein C7W93_05625 [Glaciimonas sp. PCH181]
MANQFINFLGLSFDRDDDIVALRNTVQQFVQADIAIQKIQLDGGRDDLALSRHSDFFGATVFLRDAKPYEIGAGTSKIRDMFIGCELFDETQ